MTAMTPEESVAVSLARIEASVKALGDNLDTRLGSVNTKLDINERHQAQIVELLRSDVSSIKSDLIAVERDLNRAVSTARQDVERQLKEAETRLTNALSTHIENSETRHRTLETDVGRLQVSTGKLSVMVAGGGGIGGLVTWLLQRASG